MRSTDIGIFSLPRVKQIASRNLLCGTRSSAWVYDDLEEWDAGRVGREIQEGGMCPHTADSYCCTAEAKTAL